MFQFNVLMSNNLILIVISDVRGNNLTGTIPDNIGNCTSYEILYVCFHLKETFFIFSTELVWTHYYVFCIFRDVSYNQITGVIPYNIGFLQVATL